MEHRKRIHLFWLLFPWLTAGALFVAEATGLRPWIFSNLPNELSRIAERNIGWGMLLVTFGSSARWAYLRCTEGHPQSRRPLSIALGSAILITFAHVCVAAGVLFAGCVVIMGSKL